MLIGRCSAEAAGGDLADYFSYGFVTGHRLGDFTERQLPDYLRQDTTAGVQDDLRSRPLVLLSFTSASACATDTDDPTAIVAFNINIVV